MFGGKGRPNTVKYEDFQDVAKSDQFGKAPVQNDDAFLHGVVCKAKFIGSMEIARPKSRPEIISNMRRIRYEYKARNVNKVKVKIRVAVTGLTVTKSVKKRRRRKSVIIPEELPEVILESPIYRVFFVSHDSLDRHIFSLVCRAEVDGGRKCFICAVFKAYKKSHALRIVRTVGQVFDAVCRLQDSGEGKNIPGVMPPEKSGGDEIEPAVLRAAKELEAAKEAQATAAAEAEAEAAAARGPEDAGPTAKPLIEFDDNYDFQVKTFEEQQADATYSAQQTARLQQANSTHQAESADLMREFNLTVDQQRFLTQNYQVRTGAPPSVGSGLPPHPPSGSRGMLPPMQRTPMSIQTNLSRDDSMMLNLEPERPPQLGTDEMDSGVPVNVYTDPANVSEEEAKRMLPRLFAMQKAQSAQIQLLQDQLGSETRRRVVADAKVDHLIQQNKELAGHVTWLVEQVKKTNGEAPQLPPTKRNVLNNGSAVASSAAATAGSAANADPLQGFDDSFVPLPHTVSVQNGQTSTVTMPMRKPTSSDSESDSDNDDEMAANGTNSGHTAGTEASPTPYGRLGDSTTDDEVEGGGNQAGAVAGAFSSMSPFGDGSADIGTHVAGETEKLTFETS